MLPWAVCLQGAVSNNFEIPMGKVKNWKQITDHNFFFILHHFMQQLHKIYATIAQKMQNNANGKK